MCYNDAGLEGVEENILIGNRKKGKCLFHHAHCIWSTPLAKSWREERLHAILVYCYFKPFSHSLLSFWELSFIYVSSMIIYYDNMA